MYLGMPLRAIGKSDECDALALPPPTEAIDSAQAIHFPNRVTNGDGLNAGDLTDDLDLTHGTLHPGWNQSNPDSRGSLQQFRAPFRRIDFDFR